MADIFDQISLDRVATSTPPQGDIFDEISEPEDDIFDRVGKFYKPIAKKAFSLEGVKEFFDPRETIKSTRKAYKAVTEELPEALVSPEARESFKKVLPEGIVPEVQAGLATAAHLTPDFVLWSKALKLGTIPAKLFPSAASKFTRTFRAIKGAVAGGVVTEIQKDETEQRRLLDYLFLMGIGGLSETGFGELADFTTKIAKSQPFKSKLKAIVSGRIEKLPDTGQKAIRKSIDRKIRKEIKRIAIREERKIRQGKIEKPLTTRDLRGTIKGEGVKIVGEKPQATEILAPSGRPAAFETPGFLKTAEQRISSAEVEKALPKIIPGRADIPRKTGQIAKTVEDSLTLLTKDKAIASRANNIKRQLVGQERLRKAPKGKELLQKQLSKESQFNADVSGILLGVEIDEEGNVTNIDPTKAAFGLMAGILIRNRGKININRNSKIQALMKKKPKLVLRKSVKSSKSIPATIVKDVMEGKIPPKTIAPKLLELTDDGAKKVKQMFDVADKELSAVQKTSFKKIRNTLVRNFVDRSGNIRRELLKKGGAEGREAVIKKTLAAGASSKAERLFNESSAKIYKGLSSNETKTLDNLIQSRRIVVIDSYKKGVKHPLGTTGKQHQKYVDEVMTPKLKQRMDVYFKEMENQSLVPLRDAGIISKAEFDRLVATGDYAPRQFLQYINPDKTQTVGGKLINVAGNGIKALDEGSYGILEKDSSKLLAEVVNRTQNRIFENNANKALYQLAKTTPDNGIVTIMKPASGKTPANHTKINVMLNGKQEVMSMPNEMAKEWVKSDPAINAATATVVSTLSGTPVLKAFATGYNPSFALTNLPRDVAHILLTAEPQYSSFLPYGLLQLSNDLRKVSIDVIKRKGRYIDYIDEGGGMNWLTHQGQIGRKIKGAFGAIKTVLGYAGEASELLTRLALRERGIKNGLSKEEATFIARDYLDFSQGGSVAKALDKGIPYLNAGIQGTRGFLRAAKRDKGVFVWKLAQLGGFSMALYQANNTWNKEAYDKIPDHDKANNFIITTPFSKTDKSGNKRYLYFRIAKDQSQRLGTTLFDALAAKNMGHEVNVDQVTSAAKSFSPITPSGFLPPSLDAMFGYMNNKDFWRNDDIWKGAEITAKEEYLPWTHPAYVEVGKKTGLSPERLRYVTEQFFTSNNPINDVVGMGLRKVLDKMPEEQEKEIMDTVNYDIPLLRRFVRFTPAVSKQERKRIEQVKIKDQTDKFVQNRTFDTLMQEFKKTGDKAKIVDFMKDIPDTDKVRLAGRFNKWENIKDIPEKRWWFDVSDMTPESRAEEFNRKLETSTPEKKRELLKIATEFPGFVSERFNNKLKQLRSK